MTEVDVGRKGIAMKDLFSGSGISLTDFLALSLYFLMTMTAFFALKEARHKWLNYLFLIAFVFHWFIIIVSGKPLETIIFATLLLASIAVIEILVTKKRRQNSHSPLRKTS
jgi:hypothetical protein